ncbi:hypothetical protein GCM10027343_06610 [Noviherbaspirillum agri]
MTAISDNTQQAAETVPLAVEIVPTPLPAPTMAQAEPEPPPVPPPQKKIQPKPRERKQAVPKPDQAPAPRQESAATPPSDASPDIKPEPSQAPPAVTATAVPEAVAPGLNSPTAAARTRASDAHYAATNQRPPYPRLSQNYNEEGTVLLRVLVKADGTAGAVEIKKSSGYPLLDKSASTTVRTWRFTPATVNGNPVDEWYEVPIPFKLQDN